jgi:hypothetical protein
MAGDLDIYPNYGFDFSVAPQYGDNIINSSDSGMIGIFILTVYYDLGMELTSHPYDLNDDGILNSSDTGLFNLFINTDYRPAGVGTIDFTQL